MKNITAILLSGGKSLRMGQDKGFLSFEGKYLVERMLDLLSPIFAQILIVAHKPEYQQFGYPVYADIIAEKGPLGGIYTGLSHSQTENNFVISVDMPFVLAEAIEYLLSKITPDTIHAAQNQAHFQPLFAYYPKSLLPILEACLSQNQLKLIQFVQENPHKWWDMTEFETENPLLFWNLNTQEQLKMIQNREI